MVLNFIIPEPSRTGGMRIIFEYAERLTKSGHDVILYSPVIPFYPYKGSVKRHYIKYQIRYARDLLSRGKTPPPDIFPHSFRIEFPWFINNSSVRDADVTIATSWTSAYPVHKLGSSKGRKVYFIQDYEIWNSSVKHADRSYMFDMRRITVSSYLKSLLLEKFGSDSEVILNGIDFSRFKEETRSHQSPRSILFIDHTLPNKNTEGAIEICIRLRQKYPDLLFRCFGTSRYHNLPDFVEFAENPDDDTIAGLYKTSDIFLFPSISEGFGLPPAEAMACGCALVGNNAGAVPEFAEHLKSAVICNPADNNDLLLGTELLLSDAGLWKKISQEGARHVRRKLDWSDSLARFIKVLQMQ